MSLYDRPNLCELVEAVREYIQTEVAPLTNDRRARFRALIAANVLAIVERELHQMYDHEKNEAARLAAFELAGDDSRARRRELARHIRQGHFDDEAERQRVLTYAKQAVSAKLAVSNPKFLKEYRY